MKIPNLLINILPAESSKTLPDMREHQHQHTPYSDIQYIYEYIKNGDVEKIRNLDHLSTRPPIICGRMSNNNLMQAKYAAATTACVATYIVIENGFPDEYAYSFTDVFIQEIDKLNNPEIIYGKLHVFLIQYTELMHSLTNKTKNPYILKCIHYIHVHLNHKITVEDLIKTCHLSKSHLFALFKKETGSTIFEYILQERLKESCYMLSSGNYSSIREIALLLDFCSQSYYSECFKKYYGFTPTSIFLRKNSIGIQG